MTYLHKVWNVKQIIQIESVFSWTIGRWSGSSLPVTNGTGGDAWVFEDDLKKLGSEVWLDKAIFFSLSIAT
jgi:hypothetical protein